MSEQRQDMGTTGGDQLFKNMDEQEQIYAPQQIPGGVPVAGERDAQGSVNTGLEPLSEHQVGFVPARLDPGINAPVPVPFVTHDDDDTGRRDDTTQGRG
jgi:hypothetical protein